MYVRVLNIVVKRLDRTLSRRRFTSPLYDGHNILLLLLLQKSNIITLWLCVCVCVCVSFRVVERKADHRRRHVDNLNYRDRIDAMFWQADFKRDDIIMICTSWWRFLILIITLFCYKEAVLCVYFSRQTVCIVGRGDDFSIIIYSGIVRA